jgi:parallel beta-helix repeat protein
VESGLRLIGGTVRHSLPAVISLLAFAVSGSAVAAPEARTATLSCGDRVTQDTKLTADIDCTGLTLGSAVFVVGSDITLDLNGHTIQGPSDPASVSTFGVVIRGSGDTVKGGTVTGFYVDAFVSGGDPALNVAEATFERLTLTDAATAISIYGSDRAKITRNLISDVERGIALSSSDGGTLAANVVTAKGRTDGPPCASDGFPVCSGVELSGGGGGAVVRANTVDSGGDGILVRFRGSADTLIDNAVMCVADCISIGNASGSVLERNSVTATHGTSIRIEGGSGYVVMRNNTGGSINGRGIALSSVSDSQVTENTAGGNGGFGMFVSGSANVIARNVASGNALDGILSVGTNVLTANTARDNGGLGINALDGAIDGGRNRSSGNADPQCVGVTCTP